MKKQLLYFTMAIALAVAIALVGIRPKPDNGRRRVYAALPLTGATSELGQMVKKTFDLYVNNVADCMFDLEYIDVESSSQKAITAVQQKIVNDGQPIVIAPFSYLANALISPVDQRGGFTFAVSCFSVNPRMTQSSVMYQRICASTEDIIRPVAEYAKNKFLSIAIVHSDDEYAISCRKSFENYYADGRHVIRGAASFTISSTDVRGVVAKAVGMKADAIYVTATASTAYINVFRELSAVGYSGGIITDMPFSNPFVYKALGDSAQNIVFSCTLADVFDTSKPTLTKSMMNFQELCEKNDIPPYMVTVQAYDTLLIIDYFLRNNIPFSQDDFAHMQRFQGVAGELIFKPHGECSYPCILAHVVKGRIEALR